MKGLWPQAVNSHCSCPPWAQSWKRETPDLCATCELPFIKPTEARVVTDDEWARLEASNTDTEPRE